MFNINKKKNMKSMEQEQLLGAPLISYVKPQSIQSEEYRSLRANIEFASVSRKLNSLLITSSVPMEGKTTVSANLAYLLGQTRDRKVLLVDTDLRKPTVHKTFNINNDLGLTSLLIDNNLQFNQVVLHSKELNLYLLPSGNIPANPAELLSSLRMQNLMKELASAFDFVVYDAPPVISVADAKILATNTDATLLVVRQNYSQKDNLRSSIESLRQVDTDILGFVMTGVQNEGRTYEYGYGYSRSET